MAFLCGSYDIIQGEVAVLKNDIYIQAAPGCGTPENRTIRRLGLRMEGIHTEQVHAVLVHICNVYFVESYSTLLCFIPLCQNTCTTVSDTILC